MHFLLYPFALIYHLITAIRNLAFDKGWKTITQFNLPIISVGNLRVGGTGKTPHTEYLIRLLKDDCKMAVLSRGYGRRTKGYRLAGDGDSADTIGDEPFQYFWKWKDEIQVAVSESRIEGVKQLLALNSPPSCMVLDDAFQHRYILPGFQILLSEYAKPFYTDYLLPMGRLRESRTGASRAECIVVSKCPLTLSVADAASIKQQIHHYAPKAAVYFTGIRYGSLVPIKAGLEPYTGQSILLVTGIVDGTLLYKDMQAQNFPVLELLKFPDHYNYTSSNVNELVKDARARNACLVTTEKDAVKLKELLPSDLPSYFIPIEVDFLWDKAQFNNQIIQYLSTFK